MKKLTLLLSVISALLQAQTHSPIEDDYYRIVTLPIPQNISLEVGGLATLPDGRLAASTRRGEVWLIGNPYMKGSGQPTFKRFAHGLHEPLGLMYRNNYFLLSQRGEITKLIDDNNDDVADTYESFYKWPLSGNYHEYSYGPVEGPNGELYVTLNLGWVGRGASLAKWRGWFLKFNDKAEMTPIATGLRSPAGYLALKNGEVFYAENQGDWVGSGRITHLEKGDFAGNPAGLRWTSEAGSPLAIKPSDVPDTGEPMYDVAKRLPNLKPATVWFPHTLMGISTSDMVEDNTNGGFGPFAGQVFVGDQGHSKIMRMCLEKVNNKWQGACFPFREGFQSGILRMTWGLDGSMFVGQTSRGWSATGKDPFGIQRLVWTGQTPFEMKTIKSTPDGFEVAFTQPTNKKTASDIASYKISSFTYKYHHTYGSPIVNAKELTVKYIKLSDDGLKARIVVDSLREGYIHEIKAEGVTTIGGQSLLHNFGYYTLNSIAKGEKLSIPASAAVNHARHIVPAATNKPTEVVIEVKPESKNNIPKFNAKRLTEAPAEWKGTFDQAVILGTKPGLKFDVSEVQVKAGSRIKWIFNNNDDMLHNCVIVSVGTANYVGETAIKLGLKGADMHYVPNSKNVLFHTNILQPESSETIYFTAPTEIGEYSFLCTFPGHHTLMVGKLKIVK